MLVLRNQVSKPIVAGVQSLARPTKPTISTTIDRHYERLRLRLRTVPHSLRSLRPLRGDWLTVLILTEVTEG
jgi:hypothetical protein